MPKFQYIALDTSGSRVKGVLAGASEQAVLAELESRRLTPMSLHAEPETAATGGSVPIRQLAGAYTQMSDLLRAGVPLLRGLKLLAGRKSKPKLANVFRELADRVSAGDELAKSMADQPQAFPPVHVAMVRAGEKGGFLEAVLARLGTMVLAQAELRSNVVGSMTYPAVLAFVGTAIICVIFIVFVPQFRSMLNPEQKLPMISIVVFGTSDFLGRAWPFVVGALVAAGVAFWTLSDRPDVRRQLDIVRTRMWVIGPLVRSMATARFCRMLGTMTEHGVPLLAGMQIAKDAAGNVLMEDAITLAADAVRSGQPLAAPLGASGLFDDDVVEMIAVAETANNLGEVLLGVADTTESRVNRLLASALKLIEPLLIVALASVVAMIAAALVIPMTQMSRGM